MSGVQLAAETVSSRRWKQVLKRRQRDLSEVYKVNPATVDKILAKGLEFSPGIRIPERAVQAYEMITLVLWHHFKIANHQGAGSAIRNNALGILRLVMKLVATAIEENATVTFKTPAKQNNPVSVQSSNESGKENAVALPKNPGDSAVAAPSSTRSAQGSATKNPAIQTQTSQQRAPAQAKPTSSIVQPNGKFSLANYCQEKEAYSEPASMLDPPAKTAAPANNSACSRAPPPYQARSLNCGKTKGTQNGSSDSAQRKLEEEAKRKKLFEDQRKREEKEKKIEEKRKAEEQRKIDEAKRLAKKRAKEEQQRIEEQRKRDEALKRAEKQRKIDEAKRLAEKQKREEQQRIAEHRKKEDERKRAEEQRKKEQEREEEKKRLEEQRKREQAKIAEEQRKKAEEGKRLEEIRKRQETQRKRAAEKKSAEVSAVMKAAVTPQKLSVAFPADRKPCKSSSLNERPATTLRYVSERLNKKQAEQLSSRLAKWDPYWNVSKYIKCGVTSLANDGGSKMQIANFSIRIDPADVKDKIKRTDWGVDLAGDIIDSQFRLIFRMLPVTATDSDRADGHLWPKGTFCTLNNEALSLMQRKQQSHEKTKWNGLSKCLDLTGHIKQPHTENDIKIMTYDDKPFFFCIALCRYMAPQTLVKAFVNSKPTEGTGFEKLSREESIIKAKGFTNQATLTIDDSDDDAQALQTDAGGKLVFSLTCPFSKTIMSKPVRGKQCKHYQCFDLNNFLSFSASVNGQRWRCLVCEMYLSYYDLQADGLVEDLLFEFRKELQPTDRDRIEYRSDGSYSLLGQRKQRYKKKRSAPDSSRSAPTTKKKNAEPEIILLD